MHAGVVVAVAVGAGVGVVGTHYTGIADGAGAPVGSAVGTGAAKYSLVVGRAGSGRERWLTVPGLLTLREEQQEAKEQVQQQA